jgi:hypothetical protein
LNVLFHYVIISIASIIFGGEGGLCSRTTQGHMLLRHACLLVPSLRHIFANLTANLLT